MSIDDIKKERQKWLTWKNIAPLRSMLETLPEVEVSVEFGDTIKIDGKCDDKQKIEDLAHALKPWRKGPFDLFGLFINAEWKSYIKYNLIKKHFDVRGKDVADVGCNNGYYMFRMLKDEPKNLVGFDPSAHYKTQFDFLNHFIKSKITYEMLGIEHLELYGKKFDLIFCLGVLYHRSDPVLSLKFLKNSLQQGGEVILDTFMIDGEQEVALCPKGRYSKIPNIYFIPTIKALTNWCLKAGFSDVEVLEISTTTKNEQRKTEWIDGESLDDFLDPNDETRTVEGYPAPKRVYIKIRR